MIKRFQDEILNAKFNSLQTDDKVQPTYITPLRPPPLGQSILKSPISTNETPINTSSHTAGSTEKPLRVLVFGSRMARGLTKEMKRDSDITALGNVYGGRTIANAVSRYDNQAENAEVRSVILLAGTNNVGDGENNDDVVDKVSSLLSTANKSFPKSKQCCFPPPSGRNTYPRQNMPHPVIDGPSGDSSTAIWPIPSQSTAHEHEHEQDHSSETRCVPPANVSTVCPIPINALWSMLFR